MPVTENDGTVIGIITELNILQAFNEKPKLTRVTASDNITPEVATVKPETPTTKIIKMMEDFHIIRLPVCKDEKLIGVVSRGDIIRNLIEPELMSNMLINRVRGVWEDLWSSGFYSLQNFMSSS
jgi:CBS domain-containing protein